MKLGNEPDFGRGVFDVRGRPNTFYMLEAQSRINSEPGQSGLQKPKLMKLLVYSTTAGKETVIGRLGEDGTDTVYVGGTLQVLPKTPPGLYEYDIQFTVSYQ